MVSPKKSLDRIKQQQRQWASDAGHAPDVRGYLPTYVTNLFKPLSASAQVSLDDGDGGELKPSGTRPAKMSAVHSSSALGVNVFDYWTGQADKSLLERALGLGEPIVDVRFEVKFSTGLPGNSPNLDVVLGLTSGHVIAIESKFTEWLTPKPPNKELFKPKYFENIAGSWAGVGLPKCQALAADLANGRESFRFLDAAQLLKHALGLSSVRPPCAYSLYYVYYDDGGVESTAHRQEISRFNERVGDEIRFRSLSYQDLIGSMVELGQQDHEPYIRYLHSRYFPSLESRNS